MHMCVHILWVCVSYLLVVNHSMHVMAKADRTRRSDQPADPALGEHLSYETAVAACIAPRNAEKEAYSVCIGLQVCVSVVMCVVWG